LLLFAEPLDSLDLIAIAGGGLEPQFVRSPLHALFQRGLQVRSLPLKQQFDISHGLFILVQRAKLFDTGAEASLYMILKAGPVSLPVDLHRAGAKLKISVDQIQRLPRKRRRQIRPVISRAVFHNFTRDERSRGLFIRDLYVRILLIILEQDIERRLMLFYQ